MLFNMAKNNVKKSFKDYAIYFLTLSFAVCIFYAFNTVGSQEITGNLAKSQLTYVKYLNNITNILSIFVSVILGALIVYANNFIIKRRKKEFGIYMTLGMSKGLISKILILETFLVGVISFIVGLGFGIIISQGLSILVSKLFGGIITDMTFIISTSAIIKTIIYFGVIFFGVMIFNTTVINRYKLIDLLMSGRKNEKIKVKNPILLLIIFIIGVVFLISGYWIITVNGLVELSSFFKSIVLGAIGTFLFFYGLSSFIVIVNEKMKNIYLKGLNIFVIKQIHSKINTNFISMALISLMLFVTISSLSAGIILQQQTSKTLKMSTPYDISMTIYPPEGVKPVSDQGIKYANELYSGFSKEVDSYAYEFYDSDSAVIKSANGTLSNPRVKYIGVSGYNKYLRFENKKEITLKDNEVLVLTRDMELIENLNNILEANTILEMKNKSYNVINKDVLEVSLETVPVIQNKTTVIVPDSFMREYSNDFLVDRGILLNGNVKNGFDKFHVEKSIEEKAEKKFKETINDGSETVIFATTKELLIAKSQGSSTIVLFIAIYLGAIFLLISSVTMALQQLVEAADSKDRYEVLRKIGASKSMINKAIFRQIFISFTLPMGLAIIDSIVGISVISKNVENLGGNSIVTSSLITGGVILVIYGGYMFATYIGFKNAIKRD